MTVEQAVQNNGFGFAVDIGHKIVKGFAVYFNGVQIAGGAGHHVAGFAGGFKSGGENGGHGAYSCLAALGDARMRLLRAANSKSKSRNANACGKLAQIIRQNKCLP